MSLVVAEGIKLGSTRSAWWYAILATLAALGLAVLSGVSAETSALTVVDTQLGAGFGVLFVMIMAVTAVTGEYRYGTISLTFQAIPNRTRAVLAKAGLLALIATLLGLVHGMGAYALARLVSTVPVGPLDSIDRWREVVGIGPYYAIAAVVAVALGYLVRSTAAGVAGLLLWMFVVETLVPFVGETGSRVQDWLPFRALAHTIGQAAGDLPYGNWTALAYSAVIAAGLLLIATSVVERRDT